MTGEQITAGQLGEEHVGQPVKLAVTREPALLLSVTHGGPFTMPESLPEPDPRWFPGGRQVPDWATTQLTLTRSSFDTEEPLYVWCRDDTGVRVADPSWELWHLALCRECAGHLPMPFRLEEAREDWVTAHQDGTGHTVALRSEVWGQ